MGENGYKKGSYLRADRNWRHAAAVIKTIQKIEIGITQEILWKEIQICYPCEFDTFKDYLKPRRQPPGVDRFFDCLAKKFSEKWPTRLEWRTKRNEYLSRFYEAFGSRPISEGTSGEANPAAGIPDESIRKIDETHSKVHEILAALGPQLEEIRRQGVTNAALRAIVVKIEAQMHNAPIDAILLRIDSFVVAATQEQRARNASSNEAVDLLPIRQEARAHLDAGELDRVSEPFDSVLEGRRTGRARRAFDEACDDARLLEEAAEYDRLAFNIARAVERHVEAAALLSPTDTDTQRLYLFTSASKHRERGGDSFDDASLLLSIALSLEVLSRCYKNEVGWAATQCVLGEAYIELGQREGTSERLTRLIRETPPERLASVV